VQQYAAVLSEEAVLLLFRQEATFKKSEISGGIRFEQNVAREFSKALPASTAGEQRCRQL
jgi:hypothetical protein